MTIHIIDSNDKPYIEVVDNGSELIEIRSARTPKQVVYIFRSLIPKLIQTLEQINQKQS